MPEDGTGIAKETAAGCVAGTPRANEINSRTADIEVGMVIQTALAVVALAPERKGVIAVGDNIAVDYDCACGFAEDGKLMEIPFIITADNAADLAAISYDNIKVVNGTGSSTPSISITHFAIAPMTGKTGFYLQVDNAQLETVKKAITTIAFLDCRVMITGPNGRVAYTPVRLIVSSPKCIIKDDQLSLLHTELSAPEFNKQITIDMTHDFYRLGKQNDKTTFEAFENRGLYNSQGEMADADPQFISLGYTTQGKNTTCNVTLKHDATIPAIGTYHMVERLKGYWEYDGKKYPTVCTDLQFQITIK